jgi:uncharacterized protein (DUF608 family)
MNASLTVAPFYLTAGVWMPELRGKRGGCGEDMSGAPLVKPSCGGVPRLEENPIMPRECNCAGGACKPDVEVSRREFVAMMGAGAVVSVRPEQTEAERFALQASELAKWRAELLKPGKPRIYHSDRHTDARMHLGGIGTGNLEIGADGQITTWQLFNTWRDGMVPFYFAVRAGKTARLLQTAGGPAWPHIKAVSMRGEYPIAYLTFEDDALPVKLSLEALTPFAPLETSLSSIPTAVFIFRVQNPTSRPQRVSLAAFMQNPVGYDAIGTPEGNRHAQYGGNVNSVRSAGKLQALHMGARVGKLPTLDQPVRIATNLNVDALNAPFNDRPDKLQVMRLGDVASGSPSANSGTGPMEVIWLEDAPADLSADVVRRAAEAVRAGATLVLAGTDVPLLKSYGHATQGKTLNTTAIRPSILFEDFEKGYENWTVEGTAFGTAPAGGTLPNQQRVSGFAGKGLVNSYLGGDEPTGRLTSKAFTIERRYIRFLIGGGASSATQIRLVVDGRVVRAASGRNDERLLPAAWDVSEFTGRTAQLVIVDEASGGWGHINVDNIEFTDLPAGVETLKALADRLPIRFARVTVGPRDPLTGRVGVVYTPVELVEGATRSTMADGTTLYSRKIGSGTVHLVSGGLLGANEIEAVSRRQSAYATLCSLVGARYAAPDGHHPMEPGVGELELTAMRPGSTALRDFRDWQAAWSRFAASGAFDSGAQSPSTPTAPGETVNGAVASSVEIGPGKTVEIPFVLTWRYPNKYTRQGVPLGNHYARQWPSVEAVTREVCGKMARLRRVTELFRKTFYDSTLPYYMLDCLTSQAAIIRHIGVVFRIGNGDVYGWEGSNACCQPTCTHVWGYEQTLSRLFPDLERDMRRIDFKHQQREDGGVNNRTEVPSPPRPTGEQPFVDGHASCILKAYREALNNPDPAWMKEYWPHIKRAVEYLIARDAATKDGTPGGCLEDDQWNTYDEALHGVTTFMSGYYLAALRAGEEWARRMGDMQAAARFRSVFEKGRERLQELCWDGEYFRQHLPGYEKMPGEVGPGCMADQLIGQWWAHQLGLGYLLPEDRVKSALRSIVKYNWMTDLTGWKHSPRAFAGDGDKGLMIVTWPKGGRPPHVMLYSDEVWTGIEYQVAAHLIYEGMVEDGLAIIKGARDRYDGVPRPPIPRNPWNEIECGGHYARAMSSWSALLAASGFSYDAPDQALAIAPKVTPENHRSFFCGPEGWGTMAQKRSAAGQTNEIAVAYGRMVVRSLMLETRQAPGTVTVTAGGKAIGVAVERTSSGVRLRFASPVTIEAGTRMTVVLR